MKMAASNNILCEICDAQHITRNADHWCPECEEGLCSDCQKHHSVSKYTRSHEVISIDNYRKIPTSVLKIVHHCQEHDRKYQNYCPHHDSLCCPVCISKNHKECVGLVAIEEIVKTSKTSSLLDSIEQTLKDVKSNIDRVVEDREQNLANIQKQRQKIHDEIKQVRDRVNAHLDTLERQLIQNMYDAEGKVKEEIGNLLEELREKLRSVEELKNKISAVKTYASDLQTLVGSRTIEAEVEKEEKYIKPLLEDENLQQINLKCTINNEILDILTNITTFGSISEEKSPPSVVIKTEKDKQAQIMAIVPHATPKSIHDIKVTLQTKFRLSKGSNANFTGCTICPNGRMVFVNYGSNSRLIILDDDGTLDSEISFSPVQAFDVTYIGDEKVAVSTGMHNQINIVNIASKRVQRTIKTTKWCYGITCTQGLLIYCEYHTGIQTTQLTDDNTCTLVRQHGMHSNTHLTTSGDNLYHTDFNTNTVTCYKVTGQKVWEYKDETMMKGPRGVSVDKDSNVYVVSRDTNGIVILSSDGKFGKQILSSEDGIKNPYAIYCDKDRNTVTVVSSDGNVFLYNIA